MYVCVYYEDGGAARLVYIYCCVVPSEKSQRYSSCRGAIRNENIHHCDAVRQAVRTTFFFCCELVAVGQHENKTAVCTHLRESNHVYINGGTQTAPRGRTLRSTTIIPDKAAVNLWNRQMLEHGLLHIHLTPARYHCVRLITGACWAHTHSYCRNAIIPATTLHAGAIL